MTLTQIRRKLLPCPWCGLRDNLHVEALPTKATEGLLPPSSRRCWWTIRCTACGCKGPSARPGAQSAIELWNERIASEATATYRPSDSGNPFEENAARQQAKRLSATRGGVWCAAKHRVSYKHQAVRQDKAQSGNYFVFGTFQDGQEVWP